MLSKLKAHSPLLVLFYKKWSKTLQVIMGDLIDFRLDKRI